METPISFIVCVAPRKSKGKFHIPSICGNYDLEKKKVSADVYCNRKQNSEKGFLKYRTHQNNYHQKNNNYTNCHNRDYSQRNSLSVQFQSNPSYRTSRTGGGETNYSGFTA
ncbi:hypothetical protein NPIL_17301, partial [Nephila pilipes]